VTSRNSHSCRSGSSIACPASSSEWHRVAPAGPNSGQLDRKSDKLTGSSLNIAVR
jgi:hypothetical protein